MGFDEEDFKEEIRAHLAISANEKMSDGTDPDDARYAALKEFGNVTLMREAARGVWTPRWVDGVRDLFSDVRYAVRSLTRHRGFSITVIAVLALGIGLNAAVFTMLKAMALSPLAGVDGSSRISVLYRETSAHRAVRFSYPDYRDLRDHDQSFKDLFGTIVATVGLGRERNSRSLWGEIVTGNYFQSLGVPAQLGRTLLPSDEIAPGAHPVVVISDGLWRRDFGADPRIVGRTIHVNSVPLTIVGVADASFHGTIVSYDVELFIPVMMAPQLGFNFGSKAKTPADILADRTASTFYPHGFLRPGVSRQNAAALGDALWSTLALQRPLADAGEHLRVVPFSQAPGTGQTYLLPTVMVLSVMALLVLSIACANIAGLVLVRGVSRRGEIALRLALGASRKRIVRLLIVENLVVALPGGALGILIAANGIPVLTSYAEWLAAPERLFINLGVDAYVIGFAAAVACASALIFGFVPAVQSSRVDLTSVINEDASPKGSVRGRFRSGLVVAQVAVSMLLLVAAGLVMRSLDAARRSYPGFDPAQAISVELDVKQNGYDEARGRDFYRRLIDLIRADATIQSAALATYDPLNFLDTRSRRFAIEGYDARVDEDLMFLSNNVTAGYFETLKIPVKTGRAFEDRDDERAAPVAMVNNTFAERFWGSATSAIGKRIRVADGEWRTVVGVAADIKYLRINESPRPYVYLPFLQDYRPTMMLHARGAGSVDALAQRARQHVTAMDPDLPILGAQAMERRIEGSLLLFNLSASMLFIFGVAGMALAALGTYGLVSYTVKQSSHEIGIRMALGASRGSVIKVFLLRGLRLGGAGAALGLVTALFAGNFLRGMLFGVSALDGVSFLRAVAIVIGGVSFATLVPAWRAARTNPLAALRHQ